VWKISRASVYRSLKETPPNIITRRPGPVGACSDAELADEFATGYDETWLVARHGYRTPPQVRDDQSRLDQNLRPI
jgi:hypothetical protein